MRFETKSNNPAVLDTNELVFVEHRYEMRGTPQWRADILRIVLRNGFTTNLEYADEQDAEEDMKAMTTYRPIPYNI